MNSGVCHDDDKSLVKSGLGSREFVFSHGFPREPRLNARRDCSRKRPRQGSPAKWSVLLASRSRGTGGRSRRAVIVSKGIEFWRLKLNGKRGWAEYNGYFGRYGTLMAELGLMVSVQAMLKRILGNSPITRLIGSVL